MPFPLDPVSPEDVADHGGSGLDAVHLRASGCAASECDRTDGDDLEDVDPEPSSSRRLLSWRQCARPSERRAWWEQLWTDVCDLRRRYGLAVRSRWWEDEIQVEALAAFSVWVALYDSGEWEDPPGKLSLIFELERLDPLLRDGHDPFVPDRDRSVFEVHVTGLTGGPTTSMSRHASGPSGHP
ncbi:hypothetical protein [Conexibacter sp. DBS9H8]|uniref:hypothetical protein n=1 Tax=Conexibacter sp. DBS9H8 TaxID=2937801 RepID=UPI00200C6E0C|nr:hypothetical protein [Conexibacter sp. DBS9H8]